MSMHESIKQKELSFKQLSKYHFLEKVHRKQFYTGNDSINIKSVYRKTNINE